ncbi:MAG: zinc-ribbon domain-containing protein [Actinomycetota bacterium]|nr:zinc-ribbon domain-containing protein [Actinomycetota bacterium]
MICPSCGMENKPGAEFCMACGSSLIPPQLPGQPPKGDVSASEETGTIGYVFGNSGDKITPVPQAEMGTGDRAAGAGGEASWPAEDDREAAPSSTPQPDAPGEGTAVPVGEETIAYRDYPAREEPPAPVPAAGEGMIGDLDRQLDLAMYGAGEEVSIPPETTPPGQTASREVAPAPEAANGENKGKEGAYYVPPEVDYGQAASLSKTPPRQDPAVAPAAPPAGMDQTQAMAPMGPAAAAARPRRVICPQCYAPNSEHNRFCQECGGALPMTMTRQSTAARPAAPPAGYQPTTVLPAGQVADEHPLYAAPREKAGGRWVGSFGPADILAFVSLVIAVVATVPIFTWRSGSEIGVFTHQGAYSQGRLDLLGGPGLLPYEGAEFFTVGMLAAVAIGLILVFMVARVGRGPMYIMAGCILLLPLAYLFFQAILPLRQSGIQIEAAPGLKAIFLGNDAIAGLGFDIWFLTGAGMLSIVAGFLAPPRGWGRLFTLLLFFSLVVGAAFFCATCYNWNLFIEQPATVAGTHILAAPGPGPPFMPL